MGTVLESFWDLLATVLGVKSISKIYFQSIIFRKHFYHSFNDTFTKTKARGPPQMVPGRVRAAPLVPRENTILVGKSKVLLRKLYFSGFPTF